MNSATLCRPSAELSLARLREQRLDALEVGRELVACHVLAIVAHFAGAFDLVGPAMDGTLDLEPDVPAAVTIERHIRRLSRAAEASTMPVAGRSTTGVVSAVLADEGLLDDYMRIVAVEQHMAFDDDATADEVADHLRYVTDRAQQAAKSAEWMRQRRLEDMRVCACGHSYARHNRHEPQPAWMGLGGSGPCRNFRHVEDLPCAAVPADAFLDVIRSWAVRNDVDLTTEQAEAAGRILAQVKASDRAQTLPLEPALRAAVAAVRGSDEAPR